MQPAGDLAGDRGADDAAGMADDERHLLRRGVNRGDDQIAFVLAVVIVGNDDDLAAGESVDGFADTRLRHVLLSSRLSPRLGLRRYRWRRGIADFPRAAS